MKSNDIMKLLLLGGAGYFAYEWFVNRPAAPPADAGAPADRPGAGSGIISELEALMDTLRRTAAGGPQPSRQEIGPSHIDDPGGNGNEDPGDDEGDDEGGSYVRPLSDRIASRAGTREGFNYDQWAHFYRQETGNVAPAPEDVGISRAGGMPPMRLSEFLAAVGLAVSGLAGIRGCCNGMGDYKRSNWITPQIYVDPRNSARVRIPAGWAPRIAAAVAGIHYRRGMA